MKKNKLIDYIEKLKNENLLIEEKIPEELKEKIIDNVTYDSRKVKKNTLFLCKGAKFKLEYLNEDKPYILVNNIRRAIAVLCAMYNDFPQNKINMIGITGTKGKSTTSYYIKYILDEYMKELNKEKTAIISSIDTYDGKTTE